MKRDHSRAAMEGGTWQGADATAHTTKSFLQVKPTDIPEIGKLI